MASEDNDQNISIKNDQVSIIWLVYLFITHSVTQILITYTSNYEVMTVYTIMFLLLQFVFINRYLKLRKNDRASAMHALLVAEAFLCSLMIAIIGPTILLMLIGISIINVLFAIIASIIFLLHAYFFYSHHWPDYHYFVSS